MADVERLDSQVHLFKAFHRTFVSFPHHIVPRDPDLAPNPGRLDILPVHDAANRYEPGTLVSDALVRHRQNRGSYDDTRLYSTTAATEEVNRETLTQQDLEPFPGQTTLRVGTLTALAPIQADTEEAARLRLRDQLLDTAGGVQQEIDRLERQRRLLAARSDELQQQIAGRTARNRRQIKYQVQQQIEQIGQHIQLIDQQIEELLRLSVLPFAPRPPPGRVWLVRIRRESHVLSVGGEKFENDSLYEVSLSHFRQRVAATSPAWGQLVLQAIFRSTELAFLHARRTMILEGIEDPTPPVWRPIRKDTVDAALNGVITPANIQNLHDEDRHCVICREELGSDDAPNPIALPCGPGHIMCHGCAINWAQSQLDWPDATAVSCPICRGRVLGQAEIDGIRFGLVNGVYFNDPRYTVAENARRSCADIWINRSENRREWFFVNPDLLWQICKILADIDRLEDEVSTPRHLQHVYSIHFQQSLRMIEGHLALATGQYYRTDELFDTLLNVALVGLVRGMVRGGLEHYLSFGPIGPYGYADQDHLITIVREFDRPGYARYLQRFLNCVLEFQRLRRCDCPEPGFHKHGDRDYFNEELLTRFSNDLVRPINMADVHEMASADYWYTRLRPIEDNPASEAESQATSDDTESDMTEESVGNFRPRRGSDPDPDIDMNDLYPDIFEGTGDHAIGFEEDDEWEERQRTSRARREALA